MFGKLAPNSSHLTKGLVKYVTNRGHFRAVPSQNGENLLHPRPPQSLNWSNTRTAEYRAQHTRPQCGVERFREREVGPHHSGKKTIANVIPSVAIHTSVRPPPTKTSQLSGASRDSRKRVRHREITSTASKRAVAREPTAGVVTMPDIDGRGYPVKRNDSVKMEVQLSL